MKWFKQLYLKWKYRKWIKFIKSEEQYSCDCGSRPNQEEFLESIKDK